MKSDLSKIKAGDLIWTIKEGWVTVKRRDDNPSYPIVAGRDRYTLDGKFLIFEHFPSAFPFNPFEQAQSFEGYWAMVSDHPLNKKNTGDKRFVFAKKKGKFIAWCGAETDEEVANTIDVTDWKYAQRIPEQAPVPEYTVEELTAIVGHEFKIKK